MPAKPPKRLAPDPVPQPNPANTTGWIVDGNLPCKACGRPYHTHQPDPTADAWACVRVACGGRRFTVGAF